MDCNCIQDIQVESYFQALTQMEDGGGLLGQESVRTKLVTIDPNESKHAVKVTHRPKSGHKKRNTDS